MKLQKWAGIFPADFFVVVAGAATCVVVAGAWVSVLLVAVATADVEGASVDFASELEHDASSRAAGMSSAARVRFISNRYQTVGNA